MTTGKGVRTELLGDALNAILFLIESDKLSGDGRSSDTILLWPKREIAFTADTMMRHLQRKPAGDPLEIGRMAARTHCRLMQKERIADHWAALDMRDSAHGQADLLARACADTERAPGSERAVLAAVDAYREATAPHLIANGSAVVLFPVCADAREAIIQMLDLHQPVAYDDYAALQESTDFQHFRFVRWVHKGRPYECCFAGQTMPIPRFLKVLYRKRGEHVSSKAIAEQITSYKSPKSWMALIKAQYPTLIEGRLVVRTAERRGWRMNVKP